LTDAGFNFILSIVKLNNPNAIEVAVITASAGVRATEKALARVIAEIAAASTSRCCWDAGADPADCPEKSGSAI
jgi:hypothetical protein